jgi:HPr kinase/phosphorylase
MSTASKTRPKGKKPATAGRRSSADRVSIKCVNIHATCVRLGPAGAAFGAPAAAGVLLLGPSGAGKSDLALRLIALGARLVADDRTELLVSHGQLYGRAPAILAGQIEVRGIGIVRQPYAKRVRIALAVEFGAGPRLPAPRRYKLPQGLEQTRQTAPPLVKIAPFEASAPAKIALAVAAFAHGLHCDDVAPI